ncbi:MAG: hypothetical protein LBL49_06835 [Clostridiales Family XIII bacterium]|nr:hypothetical protein [Clostridiales Family XIII bacterium]
MSTKNINEITLAPDGYGAAAAAYDDYSIGMSENRIRIVGVPVFVEDETESGIYSQNTPLFVRVLDAEGHEVRETRVLAAVTAAVAAFEADNDRCEVVVRKINRIAGPRLAWSSAGLQEAITSRRY